MKLFGKLVNRKSNNNNNSSNNNNGNNNPANGKNKDNNNLEKKIPEFVGGAEDSHDELSESTSQSFTTPYIQPPVTSVKLTDEEKGMVLVDDVSVGGENDRHYRRSVSRNRAREELLENEESKEKGYETPIIGGSPVKVGGPSPHTVVPVVIAVNENVARLYKEQSDHDLNRIESFRSVQGPPAVSSSLSNSTSFHIPMPPPPQPPLPQRSIYGVPPPPPPPLNPQEFMEVNRLMSIGYPYETALAMIGIDPMLPPLANPSMSLSMQHMPMHLPMQSLPMPPYYGPPMMPAPYQSYYPPPPPVYQMPRPASSYYEDNDAELRLAMQRSLEEEERRKQAMPEEERMLKEAVERANERAIQIALQRSFEEQFGPGSYQLYQEEQLARAMSNSAMSPRSPRGRNSIGRQGTFDFNMIHNFGSVEIEESNPLREEYEEGEEEQQEDNNRPGVYYHSPSRPFTNNPQQQFNPNHHHHHHHHEAAGGVNYIPSFTNPDAHDDSFYEIPAEER